MNERSTLEWESILLQYWAIIIYLPGIIVIYAAIENYVQFKDHTMEVMQNSTVVGSMPWGPLKVNLRFWADLSACHVFPPWFFSWLDPEEGSDVFFPNVGWLPTGYSP
jgi:hypothetical protein